MTKNEIALELTLAMIEKGQYFTSGNAGDSIARNAAIGRDVAELFNSIFETIRPGHEEE